MTTVTRREALIFSAAAAAVSAAREADAATPPKLSFITVATDVSDGTSIPVGVSIESKWLRAEIKPDDLASLSEVAVTLSSSAGDIATFVLADVALASARKGKDVGFATRIRLPVEDDPRDDKLLAKVAVKTAKPRPAVAGAEVPLKVRKPDCAKASRGLLQLYLQPPSYQTGQSVAVRAAVPEPMPNKDTKKVPVLQSVTCAVDDKDAFTMTVAKAEGLAAEVFVGFSVVPAKTGMVKMTWHYDDHDVLATARLYEAGPAAD